jgi:putative methyltransferase (TIGR04325 family)
MGTAKDFLKGLPGVRLVRRLRYERRFAGDCYGCFMGVFSSFDEARAAAPKSKHVGFDHPEYPTHHLDRMKRIESHDYPTILWLSRALRSGSKVFDFGGNVGVHYYAYGNYITFPSGISWLVCDIDGLVKLGRDIAAKEGATSLSFTRNIADAEGADIYIASGILQYVEISLPGVLASMRSKPIHVFLNKLPLYDGEQFITLQNAGAIVTPQYVFNRNDFLAAMRRAGYGLVDSWGAPGYSCQVPFHLGKDVPLYSGLYLRLEGHG